jgi:hypothetical protein
VTTQGNLQAHNAMPARQYAPSKYMTVGTRLLFYKKHFSNIKNFIAIAMSAILMIFNMLGQGPFDDHF